MTLEKDAKPPAPLVAAVDMGYGHLRAAHPLADVFGTEVGHADREPLAEPREEKLWQRARGAYEATSRASQLPLVGGLSRQLLEAVTSIDHLHPYRDQSRPTRHVHVLDRLVAAGMGTGLVAELRRSGRPLLTTYFASALAADVHGCEEAWCVVTDTDVSRAWVAKEPARSRIRYLAPSRRAVLRLQAYGVAEERISHVGFPLPVELLGGPDVPVLRRNLAARLVRLDPGGVFREPRRHELERTLGELPADQESRPPLLTYAVGGAGAQADVARRFLPGLRPLVERGRLRLALVAGLREEIAAGPEPGAEVGGLREDGNAVTVLHEPTWDAYYRAFNRLLAGTDVLWTKPSELTFYGALGMPLVLGTPVGVHESYNRRWARERGAGLKQRDARHAGQWLTELLEEGLLAAAAWSGFTLMPSAGTYQVAERLGAPAAAATPPIS